MFANEMFQMPKHLIKAAEKLASGAIKPEDVNLIDNEADPAAAVFEFALPQYDVFGEPTGTTHNFAVSVASLVDTKQRLQEAVDKALTDFDAFVANYDKLISELDKLRNKKKSKPNP
jgi:hypothetical protein